MTRDALVQLVQRLDQQGASEQEINIAIEGYKPGVTSPDKHILETEPDHNPWSPHEEETPTTETPTIETPTTEIEKPELDISDKNFFKSSVVALILSLKLFNFPICLLIYGILLTATPDITASNKIPAIILTSLEIKFLSQT